MGISSSSILVFYVHPFIMLSIDYLVISLLDLIDVDMSYQSENQNYKNILPLYYSRYCVSKELLTSNDVEPIPQMWRPKCDAWHLLQRLGSTRSAVQAGIGEET